MLFRSFRRGDTVIREQLTRLIFNNRLFNGRMWKVYISDQFANDALQVERIISSLVAHMVRISQGFLTYEY